MDAAEAAAAADLDSLDEDRSRPGMADVSASVDGLLVSIAVAPFVPAVVDPLAAEAAAADADA